MELLDAFVDDVVTRFQIVRSTGKFVQGGWEEKREAFFAFGVVTVATGKDLDQLPEGDRVSQALKFYSTTELFLTSKDKQGTSDIIVYRNEKYRLLSCSPYPERGYWRAIAARMSGA
jgi:hypothetical protein